MSAPVPRMHGLTHVPGGPDPIPGLDNIPDPSGGSGGSLLDLILAVSPDAFWKLNETSGSVAADSSGNGRNLTVPSGYTAPTWAQPAGPPGETTALWDTSNDRLSSNTLPAFTDNFTAAVWVNRVAAGGGEIMGQGTPYHAGAGWGIQTSGNKWAVFVAGNPTVANSDLVNNTWYFVAVVRDAGTWKLYVNGLLQTDTDTGSPGSGYGSNTWLGNDAYSGHTSSLNDCLLSYAFIVDSVLTGSQLLAMYEAGTSGGTLDEGLVWTTDGDGGASWQTPAGGAPSGPAGGVLSGTYPNPGFAQDMATQTELDTGLNSKVSRDAVEAASARLVATKLAAGDAQPAFRILGDGKHEWGPGGSAAPDTNLYRLGANDLKTDGSFRAANLYSTGEILANNATANRITLGVDGRVYLGSAGDTNLYRGAANRLQTDGDLYLPSGDLYARAGNAAGQIVLTSSGMYFGTNFLTRLYRAADGQLGMTVAGLGARAIEVGVADSGGAGYRTLRVAN